MKDGQTAQYASATELSRLYGGASVNVGVNRRGAIGLEFVDVFRRSDRTSTLSLPYAAISTYNAVQLAVPWRPGGRIPGELRRVVNLRQPAGVVEIDVFAPQDAAVAALTRRVKESFDPKGVLNPGRMWAGT